MEKKNTILLTIIAIATLLISVVGATFAYFASTIKNDAKVGVNVNTSSNKAIFMASADGNINFTVDSSEMLQSDATDDGNQSNNENLIAGLTSSANINVTLKASDDGKNTTCSYDIVYTWTGGEDNFSNGDTGYTSASGFYPSKYYVRTGASSSPQPEGFKEFTIEGTLTTGKKGDESPASDEVFKDGDHGEKNIDTFAKPDNGKITLVKGETITSQSTSTESFANYQFTMRFYNLNKDQSDLMNKHFSGTISVENVKC